MPAVISSYRGGRLVRGKTEENDGPGFSKKSSRVADREEIGVYEYV
jgi:hypothetical protein